MDNKAETLKYLLGRSLIALPFAVVGIHLFIPLSYKSIPGIFLLVIAAILIGKPIAALFTSSASSLLFPASAGREVLLVFSIPEAKIISGEYEEALALYLEMIPLDPKRLEIYMRIMDLAVHKMKRPETAREAYHRGLKNIRNVEDKQALARQYRRITEV